MKTITILTNGIHPLQFAPITGLSQAKLVAVNGWSTVNGATGPFYQSFNGDVHVLPPEWSEAEIKVYADMIAFDATKVELPDEEADALIAKTDRNLIRR
jgi:hypothetical protein